MLHHDSISCLKWDRCLEKGNLCSFLFNLSIAKTLQRLDQVNSANLKYLNFDLCFFSVLICYTKGKEGKLMVTPTNQPTDRLTLSDETGSRDRFWDQNGLKTSMETILRPKCDTIWRLVPRPFLRPKWSRDQYQDQNVTLCRPTDWQGEYSAICLSEGWKIEGRDLQYNREIQIPQEH